MPSGAQIRFSHPEAWLDTLSLGEQADHAFTFRMDSALGARINYISSSCDCATPEWPHSHLAPLDSGQVYVSFKPRQPGLFEKTFTVYDSLRRPVQRLTIRGYVRPQPGQSWFRVGFAYNQTEIDTLSPSFNQFIAVAAKAGSAKMHIESSASRVPTKSYKSNYLLAQARAITARRVVQNTLLRWGLKIADTQIATSARVQGPAYNRERPLNDYQPYQYIRLLVEPK